MTHSHWSYSQLATYLRCPLQHFFRYVLCLPERTTSSALALGSAIHQALAVFHRAAQRGEPAPVLTVQAAFRQAWEERRKNELIVFQHGDEQDTIDQGMALLALYIQQPPPPNIMAVEQQFVTPLVNSQGEVLDKSLVAVIDLIHRNDDDDLTVVDLKTSGRAYSDMEAQMSLQATAYLYTIQQHYNEPAAFQYKVLVKTKKPHFQQIATARMPSDFDRFGDLVEAIDRAVTAGVHYPVELPINCSGCAYRKPCREWQSDQTLPATENRIPLSVMEGNGCVG